MVVHIGKLLIGYQIIISLGVVCLHVLLINTYMDMEKQPPFEIEKPDRLMTQKDHTISFCLTNDTRYTASTCPGLTMLMLSVKGMGSYIVHQIYPMC